jgi:hypothetical protein
MSEFSWSTGCVVSVSALLDPEGLTEVQIDAVKADLAASIARHAPGVAGSVKAARAEAGSRSYKRVGQKIELS